MNCPKCNSPINDGDKFCQVCGNVLNNQPQPNVVPQMAPQNQMHQQLNPQINQSSQVPNQMPSQPMNQMGGNPNQFNNMPNQSKKNNAIVYFLVGVVIILIIVVVILFVNSNKEENKENNSDNEVVEEKDKEDDDDETPPDDDDESTVNNKNTINGITFNLPSGYIAMEQEGNAAFTDTSSSFVSIVMPMDGNYDLLTVDGLKAELEKSGYTDLISTEKTVNGKKMIVFSLNVSGLNTEIIYVKYSSSVILVASTVYVTQPTSAKQSEIYNIITNVELKQ